MVSGVFNNTRPFTRAEMGEYIGQVIRTYQDRPEEFSRVDLEQLRYLTLEFQEELNKKSVLTGEQGWHPRLQKIFRRPPLNRIHKWVYSNNRNALSYHYREFNLYADPVLSYSSQQLWDPEKKRYHRSRLSNGFLFRGNLGNHVGFYFNLTDNHVQDGRWENQKVPYEVLEESGWPFLTRGENGSIDFDENAAFITFRYKYFYLLYGRDYNQWGVGHNGNLMLSTNAPLYDQIKMAIRYWRFKYTHITAFLQYIPPPARISMKTEPYTRVYWSGNRLELDMGAGLQVGFSEAIVYGDRPLQIGYLNPLSFFKSLEHYYGDRDNGALGADLEWRIISGIKIFGEWFIDDITTTKLGTDFYGNKFGWQGGLLLVNPFHIPDIDLLVEYSRIKPYVYSQSFRDYNKYKQYDTILGHYIGPNSDDWFVRLQKRFSKFLQVGVEYERYRHGSNPKQRNVGGDPDHPHQAGDPVQAPFLDGIPIEHESWGLSLQYELVRNLFGEFRFRRFRAGDAQWENMVSWRISFNFGYRDERLRNVFPAKD